MPRDESGAAIQFGQDELFVPQSFCRCHSSIQGTNHHGDERVSRLIQRHLAAKDSAKIDVDMFAHGVDGFGICRGFDGWNDRITNNLYPPFELGLLVPRQLALQEGPRRQEFIARLPDEFRRHQVSVAELRPESL